jgi:hypothetical protein
LFDVDATELRGGQVDAAARGRVRFARGRRHVSRGRGAAAAGDRDG